MSILLNQVSGAVDALESGVRDGGGQFLASRPWVVEVADSNDQSGDGDRSRARAARGADGR